MRDHPRKNKKPQPREYHITAKQSGEKAIFNIEFSGRGLRKISRLEVGEGGNLPELLDREGSRGEKVREFLETFMVGRFKEAGAIADNIPIDPEGTSFQKTVWGEIKKIPAGQVLSYGEIAKRLGKPRAARAVGNACGANPLFPLVPCHRVIAFGDKLGGFSSDLNLKKRLLKREGVILGK